MHQRDCGCRCQRQCFPGKQRIPSFLYQLSGNVAYQGTTYSELAYQGTTYSELPVVLQNLFLGWSGANGIDVQGADVNQGRTNAQEDFLRLLCESIRVGLEEVVKAPSAQERSSLVLARR